MNTLPNASYKRAILHEILSYWGLTYVEFGQKMNISRSVLHKWRTGQREPNLNLAQIKALQSLLTPLGLNIWELPEDWIIESPEENAANRLNSLKRTHAITAGKNRQRKDRRRGEIDQNIQKLLSGKFTR